MCKKQSQSLYSKLNEESKHYEEDNYLYNEGSKVLEEKAIIYVNG